MKISHITNVNILGNLIKPIFLTLFSLIYLIIATNAQTLDRINKGRAKDMLNAVKNEIKSNYYDADFHNINLDEQFKVAEQKIENATSLGQAFGIIAQTVLSLNDSHTTFYPPSRASVVEYGWRMQMIGDNCFITAVKPKSDAEKQGLRVGDEVLQIEGFRPTRKEIWKINYYYNTISPRTTLNIKVKRFGEAEPIAFAIASQVTPIKAKLSLIDLIREIEIDSGKHIDSRFVNVGNTVVWKFPTFSVDPNVISSIMADKIRNSPNLILDLRDNGGGYVVTLAELAGYFVEKDTKIADLKGRKPMDPQIAKTKKDKVYHGRLVILINQRSASASEIFSRFMQLQERAVVIGDQSAGAVMQSRVFPMQLGVDTIIPYGMSVTNADVIMSDGLSLEHFGVTPQLKLTPTAKDISSNFDPVLAAAFELLGERVSPAEAGKMFPFIWEN